jgi:hypothetical protein
LTVGYFKGGAALNGTLLLLSVGKKNNKDKLDSHNKDLVKALPFEISI